MSINADFCEWLIDKSEGWDNQTEQDENEKYRKTKKSSKSKSAKKSKHKHEYEPVLLKVDYSHYRGLQDEGLMLGKRCIICGKAKITEAIISETLESQPRLVRMLSYDEILEKYSDLPVVEYDWRT